MSDDERPIEYFTETELTALSCLLSAMLRIDGQASEAEREALVMFAKRVRIGERNAEGSAYRASAGDPTDEDGVDVLQPYLDRAGERPVTREDFLAAANVITDPEARDAIYAALYDISAADIIVGQEWQLLKILVDTWNLEVT
ncbi:hypothetical protein BH09MYX1_BH09MYX1_07040 [soil metagenome]